jgi:protein ImuB
LFDKRPMQVIDELERPVLVSGRGDVSRGPARVSIDGAGWKKIIAWAGPWLLDERWWDNERARRRARFQLVDEDGEAILAYVEQGEWWLAGTY